ncbi:DUF262 domain-containing protein [Salinisphaera aquimarina]|uniref:DUF262 domain-containing protein n=1 Tax=Salinisphaera aquimarina TaxID=2094031 RepID=A0ABV7EQH5_9GAMM
MSDLYTLSNIMRDVPQGRFFSIPDYQRGYSWQNSHRDDLLSDIDDLRAHDAMHFTGTIVAAELQEAPGIYEIVDGQQRLTSLLLLIDRLLLELESRNLYLVNVSDDVDTVRSHYLRWRRNTGNSEFRLKLNGGTERRFEGLVSHRHFDAAHLPSKNKADDNLVEGAQQFDQWLALRDEEQLRNVFELVTTRLGFLFYSPKNTLEVGLMFEVINSRGKPLSELEKVKNFLIFYANRHGFKDLHRQVNDAWITILDSLNRIDMTTNADEQGFLRACWVVFGDPSPRPRKPVYEALRLDVSSRGKEAGCRLLQEFVSLLEYAATTYVRLHSKVDGLCGNGEEDRWLKSLAFHPRLAGVLPLVVALYQKERGSSARAETLELIEKLNFRYFVVGIAPRADSSHAELFDMAHRYFQGRLECDADGGSDNDELQRLLTDFIGRQAKIGSVIKHLILESDENWDFYEWQGLKFFLASYEQGLREQRHEGCSLAALLSHRDRKSYNDFYNREHLVARQQREDIDEEWVDYLQRRLGNFILLREGTNKSVSASRVEEKVSGKYQLSDHTMLYQVRELESIWEEALRYTFSDLGWKNTCRGSRTQVLQRFGDLREERLVRFALERWHVAEVDGETPMNVLVQSTHRKDEYGAHLRYSKAS